MKIHIPEIPPSLNKFAGRQNVKEYRREKSRWKDMIGWLCKGDIPPTPIEKAKVILRYYFPDKKRRDPDNYAGKFIMDGLTEAGIIKDDSFNNVILQLEGYYDKDNPRTEVEVIPWKDIA